MMFAGVIRGSREATASISGRAEIADIVIAGQRSEIAVWSLSPTTVRITVCPLEGGANSPAPVPATGALVHEDLGTSVRTARDPANVAHVQAGDVVVDFTPSPPTIHIRTTAGDNVQTLILDAVDPRMSFPLGDGPLLGFGEGGAQFDRRGAIDDMRSGQGARSAGPRAFSLATHGTRAPVQWLIGAQSGWAMFIHQPYGAFDLTSDHGVFTPREAGAAAATTASEFLPLDVFMVATRDPVVVMREYARITGLPEMPARWTLGYMQSSRTLAGPDEILGIPRTFREKKLPCDALIYLGTEFAPSGWNTRNGEFTWNPANFPDPKAMLDEIHSEHFRVVVHVVLEGHTLTGRVTDPCTAPPLPSGRAADNHWPPNRQVPCYWPFHKPVMETGVDGWWPDQGDGLDGPSRLNRHRMYWEGSQLYRPRERPFALHRNASPGIQRFGGFIWSGDTRSRWETLATHVSVAINTGLSGFPYWGSDIGGFNPTAEYTGELHVRWFQFGAFCPSFRAHGRNWHLKLPWGWSGGKDADGGPFESGAWREDPAELHDPQIEVILRKYLELRYRLLPYLYTAVRETHETGLPIMRALWLHYPTDAVGTARGDEYLWGRDMLVAPVVEKGATARTLYLPGGTWYDFWNDERVEGGREITRPVDLETMPLYVRAGAVLPLGPVRQYADEPTDEPITLVVYPGVDGSSALYDDDGISFDHVRGEWMKIAMNWQNASRRLTLRLAPGSRMLPPTPRRFAVRVAGSSRTTPVAFTGEPVSVRV